MLLKIIAMGIILMGMILVEMSLMGRRVSQHEQAM